MRLGQLVQVNDHSDTRSGSNGTTWKYTYDLGGNILKKERFAYADTTTPLETVTYTYGDANWRDKLTAVNGNAIRYDAIGNPLSDRDVDIHLAERPAAAKDAEGGRDGESLCTTRTACACRKRSTAW